jgi:hypothetical protein
MSTHREINFSPFAVNVLDAVDDPTLCTPDGTPVKVGRRGMDFTIRIGGQLVTDTADNLDASCVLNCHQVGRMAP